MNPYYSRVARKTNYTRSTGESEKIIHVYQLELGKQRVSKEAMHSMNISHCRTIELRKAVLLGNWLPKA